MVFRIVYCCNTHLRLQLPHRGLEVRGSVPRTCNTQTSFFTLFCHLLDSCPQRFISASLLTGVNSIDLEIPFSTSASGREVTQFSSVCSLLGRALLRRYTSYQAGCLSSCCLHIYGSIDVPSCRLLISAENKMKCLVQKAGLSYQVK